MSKEVVKNTKFNKLNTKVNRVENKTSDVTTLIHINQYNIVEQSLEKKVGDVDQIIPNASGLETITVLNAS